MYVLLKFRMKQMIRKFKEEDTTRVMALWTKGNFEAHDFIDKDYWLLNYNEVKEKYLKNAETYVYVKDNEIIGFISLLNDGYIGALFVCRKFQRQGIGRTLINYCKDRRDNLILKVYEKNVSATLFYVALGFVNTKIQIDDETGEKEYIMKWNKNK